VAGERRHTQLQQAAAACRAALAPSQPVLCHGYCPQSVRFPHRAPEQALAAHLLAIKLPNFLLSTPPPAPPFPPPHPTQVLTINFPSSAYGALQNRAHAVLAAPGTTCDEAFIEAVRQASAGAGGEEAKEGT
jgi:hypothetical protein